MGNAEYTATVRLADGTLARLEAWYNKDRQTGGYTLCTITGKCAVIEARGAMGRDAWQDAMRVLLGRREAARPEEGE